MRWVGLPHTHGFDLVDPFPEDFLVLSLRQLSGSILEILLGRNLRVDWLLLPNWFLFHDFHFLFGLRNDNGRLFDNDLWFFDREDLHFEDVLKISRPLPRLSEDHV